MVCNGQCDVWFDSSCVQCGRRTSSYLTAVAAVTLASASARAGASGGAGVSAATVDDCSIGGELHPNRNPSPSPPPPPPPPAPSVPSVAVTDQLHLFLRGEGPGPDGKHTIADILDWDYARMERVHNYIQWVFPNKERSQFNMAAPVMTEELAATVAADLQAMANVKAMFRRYLAFAGLELLPASTAGMSEADTDSREAEQRDADHLEEAARPYHHWIAKTADFSKRHSDVWGGTMNHNWLRISRILKCLGMLGMVDEQQAFFSVLESLWGCGEIAPSAHRSYTFWLASAGLVGQRAVPPHPVAQGEGAEAQQQQQQRGAGGGGGWRQKLCCHL